jgi:hypothetical protein
MFTFIRMLLVAGRLLLGAAWLLAQVAIDPSGHWEGAIAAPSSGGTFRGIMSEDGKSIAGNFASRDGQYSLPFTVTRMGDAKITPTPKSAPIGKALEGTWTGTLEANGKTERLVLRMANQPGGFATGTIVDLDGSGVEIPIGMSQKGSNVTIELPSVGASYAGVLNAAGTEITGTWTQGQGPAVLTLTFRRAADTK